MAGQSAMLTCLDDAHGDWEALKGFNLADLYFRYLALEEINRKYPMLEVFLQPGAVSSAAVSFFSGSSP